MKPEPIPTAIDEVWLAESLRLYAENRDTTLRDQIAGATSWIAQRSARRFWDRGEPFDDLVQVAHIGLLKAIDRFDPEQGVPFGAYATPTIMGELRRHFRDHTWSVHVPRGAKDLRPAVNAARDQLSKDLQRSPLISEIADHLHVSADAVIEALDSNNAYRTYALDGINATRTAAHDTGFDDVVDRDVISALLDRLAPRERTIIQLRFFDELSQAEIAERIGTSQVHVGRLITSSLACLRRHLEAEQRSD